MSVSPIEHISETPTLQYAPAEYMVQPEASPDSLPQVSFDIGTNQQVTHADFDTQGYAAYLRERGLTDEQVAGAKLRFDNKPFALARGRYDDYTGTAHARVSQWYSEKAVNNAVAHETEHHINELTGFADTWRPLTYANNIGSLLGTPAMIAGNLAQNAELLPGNTGRTIAYIGAAAFALGQVAYYSNPDEIKAHKAGHDAPQFFTMTRRKIS